MLQIHNMRDEELRKSFANSLRCIRLDLHSTAKDISELLGIYRSRWSDYERAKKVPSKKTFDKIVKGLEELGVDELDIDRLERDYMTTLRYSSNRTVGRVNIDGFTMPEQEDDDDDSIAHPDEVVRILNADDSITQILDDIPET